MADAEKYAAWIVANPDKKGTPEFDTVAKAYQAARSQMSPDTFAHIKSEGAVKPPPAQFVPSGEKDLSYSNPEMLAAHPLTRFSKGAGAPFVGGAQLVLNAVGQGEGINNALARSEAMTKKGRKELGSEGFDWWQAGGNVVSPAFMAAGAAMPATATAGGRIVQGMGMGGLAGLTEPVTKPDEYWGTKGIQTGTGMAVGGVLPAGWELTKLIGRGARNVVQPFMGEWGRDQAAGRLANTAAGDRKDALIAALKNPNEIVPGSKPTAGQAAVDVNSAEFSALQKLAAERQPSEYYGPQGIEGQQNTARLNALRTIGKTPQALESAIENRALDAERNYGLAYAQQIKADPALAKISENPYFKDALPDALKLAEAEGSNAKNDLTRILHFVKISLDKQVGRVGDTALSNTERRAVQDVKTQLMDWLSAKNPAYGSARDVFAAQSKPINQMQVGQELEKRLIPALSEDAKQRAGMYATALQDAPGTIKRATGQPRFEELNQIMRPDQMETLRAVKADLERNALVEALASKGLPAARERIGAAVPQAPAPGMFSPILSAARAGYNRLTGKATDKIMMDLAEHMKNPQEMARIMESAKPYERKALVDALMRYQAIAGSQAVNQGVQQ